MKNCAALLFAFLVLSSAQAKKCQLLKVVSASRTHWSGGIAGRSGTNYNLTLSCSSKYKIALDSIWFKDEGTYGLKQEANHSGFSLQVKAKGDKTNFTYEIIAGSVHQEKMTPRPDDFEKLSDISNPFPVKGEAVVSYVFNKKKYFLAVPAFTNNPPINYP